MMAGIIIAIAYHPTDWVDTYSGKELFTTQEEYSNFKSIISKEKIEIKSTNVLSSDPPIVVSFKIQTPRVIGFPYGSRIKSFSSSKDSLTGGLIGGGFVTTFGVTIALALSTQEPLKLKN